MSRGKLIVIEGTDGSGKTVQTQLLMDRLRAQHIPVATLSFPSYREDSAVPVEMYLAKKFGSVQSLGPYIPSPLFTLDRAIKARETIIPQLEAGISFVLNRYTGSNAGHQGGKIRNETDRQYYLDWLFDFEFDKAKIPVPDLTVLLHLPSSIGKQLAANKPVADSAIRVTGDVRQADAHEEDPYHLEDAEAAYLYVAKRYPNWKTVQCLRPELVGKLEVILDEKIQPEEKIRSREDIHSDVYAHVRDLFAA